MKIFDRPIYEDMLLNKYKSSSYVSRSYNHNFKRLILKRCKFIKKYNKLNEQCKKLFKYKPMKITLTDSS